MNFVIVKHPNDSGRYLFQIQDNVKVDSGTVVKVDTSKGKDQIGICITPSFESDPEVLCPLWGTMPHHMKRVTRVMREFVLQYPEDNKEK